MKTKQKTYYLYQAEPKDTSCEKCLVNHGRIFEEENLPLLPVHPNCNCTAKIIEPIPFMETLLVNVKEGEYYIDDDFLPQARGRYWMRISLSPIQKLYYSNDGLVFLTNNKGETIRQVQFNEEMFERLYSLPMIYTRKMLDYLNKSVNDNENIVKPDRSEGEYLYFIMDDGTELRANMDTLNGLGILPNGKIIVGYGRNDPQYYYDLLVLREKYTEAKNNNSSDKEILDITMTAWKMIQNKYPENDNGQINTKYRNAWKNIPDDYYQINDVTDEINNIFNGYVKSEKWENTKNKYWVFKYFDYFNAANTDNEMDLKNNPDWYHQLYIYDGEILDVDAFGNIILGFVGAYLGFDNAFLHFCANSLQRFDDIKDAFKNLDIEGIIYNDTVDDPRDTYRINQGYDLYYRLYGDKDE